NFRRRHRFVAGTERACRLRLRDLRGAERGSARVEFAAAAQRERKALAAHIDDVGDDAGYRILDPDQRAVANFVFNRHRSILSLGAPGFSTRAPLANASAIEYCVPATDAALTVPGGSVIRFRGRICAWAISGS